MSKDHPDRPDAPFDLVFVLGRAARLPQPSLEIQASRKENDGTRWCPTNLQRCAGTNSLWFMNLESQFGFLGQRVC